MTALSLITNSRLAINAIPTLNQTFTALPQFRKGGTPINSPPKRLSDPGFSWKSGYIWEHNPVGTTEQWPPPADHYPAWTSNGTADTVPNADMIEQTGVSPYSWNAQDGLVMTPRVTPPDILPLIGSKDLPATYISGALTSFPYAQMYGVFAMTAKLPKGNGMWPAFWLMPWNQDRYPEIDIVEVLGKDTTKLYTTLHTKPGNKVVVDALESKVADMSAGFHEYALDWGPEELRWYLDRQLVFTQPTPSGGHKPFYILANLAVGKKSNWGGAPAIGPNGQPALSPFKIKSIKAWQRPAYV